MLKKKLFYGRRFKIPVFLQIYVAWFAILAVSLPLIFWKGSAVRADWKPVKAWEEFSTARVAQSEISQNPAATWTILQRLISNKRWIFRNLLIRHSSDGSCRRITAANSAKPASKAAVFLLTSEVASKGYLAVAAVEAMLTAKIPLRVDVFGPKCGVERFTGAPIPTVVVEPNGHGDSFSQHNYRLNSINWRIFFPESEPPPLSRQIGSAVLGGGNSDTEGLRLSDPMVHLWQPKTDSSNPESLRGWAVSLSAFLRYANGADDFVPGSFLRGQEKQVRTWVPSFLLIMFLALIFFPVINQLYLTNTSLRIPDSLIAAAVFSVVPVLTLVVLKFLAASITSFYPLLVVAILIGSLLFLAVLKVMKKVLMLKVNVASALVCLDLNLIWLAFINPVLFLFLAVLPVFFSRIGNRETVKSILMLVLGLVPLGFFMHYTGLQQKGVLSGLFSQAGPLFLISFSLLTGAILSLINRDASFRE